MYTPDLTLGPEWALLELACLGLTTPSQQEWFAELLTTGDFSWGELIEQALRHKMLPTLAYHVLVAEVDQALPKRVRGHLCAVLDVNRHKRTLWYGEAARIVQAIQERGGQVVGRKDVVFESTLYGGNGSRRLGDIDFLIPPQDRELVMELMPELGYQVGLFNWRAGQVMPLTRKEIMLFRLNPDHVPVFAIATGDPVVRDIEVDFANSLTWHRSPFEVPVELALQEVSLQPIAGFAELQMPALAPRFQFISTVLHLFREAWLERWLEWEQDVDLLKFSDVLRLWTAHQETLRRGGLLEALEEFEIVDPVLWVLEHLDRTFGIGAVAALGLEGRVTESFLHSARASGGELYRWTGSMRERLQCKDRRSLFVPGDPA